MQQTDCSLHSGVMVRGVDIRPAAQKVFDAAVETKGRQIRWFRFYAEDEAYVANYTVRINIYPKTRSQRLKNMSVAIKGLLTTPVRRDSVFECLLYGKFSICMPAFVLVAIMQVRRHRTKPRKAGCDYLSGKHRRYLFGD